MRLLVKSLLLLYGLAIPISAQSAAAPQVDLGYVRYSGVHNETLGINTFHGIRFAAPPTGQLRWRAAIPIEERNNYSHTHVINASIPGPQCVQVASSNEAGFLQLLSSIPGIQGALGALGPPRNNSEDCLLLDVIVPSKPKSKSLPVVIQIHGGAYITGNSQTADGSQFVSYAKGGVIWVQIQYRLNSYGFLGAKEVLDDGDANVGLTDQRVAFDWVQRNIHFFGGDPAQVTIWGQSAGGGSVMNQLIIDTANQAPPFRAAIAEFPWWQPYHEQPVLETQYEQLLNASGCTNLACLRDLPADKLANASFVAAGLTASQKTCGYGDGCYGPYVDGSIIRDLPSNEFKRGNFHKVPLLVDHDGEEGVLFQNQSINTTEEVTSDLQVVWPAAGPSFFDRLYELYNISSFTGSYFSNSFFSSQFYEILSSVSPNLQISADDSPYWQVQQVFGDNMISCPTYYMGTAMSGVEQAVWKLVCTAGVYVHGATGIYLLVDSNDTSNATLANIFKDWFMSFIADLDPNSMPSLSNTTRPDWPEYRQQPVNSSSGPNCSSHSSPSQFTIMRINDTNVGPEPDADASERCDFLHSQSNVVRN